MFKSLVSFVTNVNTFLNIHVTWCLWLPIVMSCICLSVNPCLHKYYCRESVPGIGYIESYSITSGRGGSHCHLKVFYQVDGQLYWGGFSMSLTDFRKITLKNGKYLQVPIKISSVNPEYISYY